MRSDSCVVIEQDFRKDINGLRAWAVVAVVLFHFNLLGVSGGFVGVDIFFVISGYLMTQIVVVGLENGDFSIRAFYMARLRRILPALLVMIVVLLALGWFWLPNADYHALGGQSTYALTFLSNVYYWRTAGYFDVAAHEKWLLHTWSLGVEAQFYLLFPVIVSVLWRFWSSLKLLTLILFLLFFASLSLSIWRSQSDATMAFYLLPMRLWELLAGGLVFLVAKQFVASVRVQDGLGVFGWLLIIGSLFKIDSSMVWPSYWTVMPVLGASLVVFASQQHGVMIRHQIVQWLGKRSYSLYLWHWPWVVALYFTHNNASFFWLSAGLVASVALAVLSYRWIELPSRRYLSQCSIFKQFFYIAGIALIVLVASLAVKIYDFKDRVPDAVAVASNASQSRPVGGCFVNDRGVGEVGCLISGEKTGVLLAGDSHSEAIRSALNHVVETTMPEHGVRYWGLSACPTVKDVLFTNAVKQDALSCKRFNQHLVQTLSTEYMGIPLVLLSRTASAIHGYNGFDETPKGQPLMYFDALTSDGSSFARQFADKLVDTACELAKNRPVYLMRPIPEMVFDVPKTLSRNRLLGLGDADIKIPRVDYEQRQRFIWDAQDRAAAACHVHILDPLPYLCDDQFCYGSYQGTALYYDDEHLSEYGSQRLLPLFRQIQMKTEEQDIR
jgi:peptidoglycan/LPS O-acetylase OafA/YrhL